MPTTANYGWVTPSNSDASTGPAQMTTLATAIDTTVKDHVPLFVRKTANETITNSTTLQNDDVLLIAPAISTVYTVDGFIKYTANVSADFKFAFTHPTGSTLSWTGAGLDINTATAGHGEVATNATDRLASGTSFSFGGSDAFVCSLQIKGLLIMGSTAGNLQAQWAQNSAHASDVVVFRDSWLRLWKVA